MGGAAALAMTAALLHALNHTLFKSLLFFGAGAVLTATGARDMGRLGGLLNRMPATGLFMLVGCVAISALPPLNGFVSEWLILQAVLLGPQFPQWTLKLLAPTVGALDRADGGAGGGLFRARCSASPSSAARARRRRPRRKEVDRFSLTAMGALALLCLLAGLLPGPDHRRAEAGGALAVGATMPLQSKIAWLSIAPIAASRSSYNGLLVFMFIIISGSARGDRDPPPRLGRAAARAGLGLRLSRCRARRRNTRPQSFQPADPARVRRLRVSRARAASICRRPATCGRRALRCADAATGSGDGDLRADRARRRRPRDAAQRAAVPDHPAISEHRVRARWSLLLLVLAGAA